MNVKMSLFFSLSYNIIEKYFLLNNRVAQIPMMDLLTFVTLLFFYTSFQSPFEEARQRDTCRRICDVDIKFTSFLPPLASGLIQRFLQLNSFNRIEHADVGSHPWITHQLVVSE